jgi:hypothetical protein
VFHMEVCLRKTSFNENSETARPRAKATRKSTPSGNQSRIIPLVENFFKLGCSGGDV